MLEQSLLRGMMVNVTSQRMLNALAYKRLHKLSAISGCKKLQSQVQTHSLGQRKLSSASTTLVIFDATQYKAALV